MLMNSELVRLVKAKTRLHPRKCLREYEEHCKTSQSAQLFSQPESKLPTSQTLNEDSITL